MSAEAAEGQSPPQTGGGYAFGTFKGVFTPSILTILGVVMYLRMGWVLGQVGLPTTLVIVTLASGITFLTALSLASLATNMRVGGGGAYYIISRSLGLETGAAVGLPLFLAQALGVAFYIAGFSESLVGVFPSLDPLTVGLVTLVALTGLAYWSADLALKSQYVIMAAIGLSLVSFFLGGPTPPDDSPASPGSTTYSFWPVFAVFFPAVTGIEAGIAMSGDLKDSTRSLPRGTLAAVVIGYAVYIAIPVFMTWRGVPAALLRDDPLVMQQVARWGPAVLVGIWAASLSSAMGALLGAPRTLQALARDRVAPAIFARGFGANNDPRIATMACFAIAITGVLLGDLNAIAPILSMFFLTSYGVLNLSAGLEELISNPAWRPRFKIPAWISLAGFAACLGVMLMLAPGATMLATVVSGGIYAIMKRRALRAHWGDLRLGLMMYVIRVLLYRMSGLRLDERTWKPNLLVLSGSPTARWYLIELADAIAQSRSFVTVATFIGTARWNPERAEQITESIRSYLRKRGVPAFIRTLAAEDPFLGASALVRAYGFGPIAPNTVLIGETERPSNFEAFGGLIRTIVDARKNLVIVREHGDAEVSPTASGRPRRIDLWWPGNSTHGAFALAVTILLHRSDAWRDAVLHVKTIVDVADQRDDAQTRLQTFLAAARIDATAETFVDNGNAGYPIIPESSRDADLVVVTMRGPDPDETAAAYSEYYRGYLDVTEPLPATAMVLAGERVEFRNIFS